jgi:hypothetical protein
MIDQNEAKPSPREPQDQESLLDEALEETFPASDPVSSLKAEGAPSLPNDDPR